MPNSPSFVEHALDLLAQAGPVQARRMFGGHGLYLRGVMFGLLDDDELFLKTDGETRGRFLEAGCRTWVYPGADQTSYYRPPDEAHEDAESMRPWASLGIEAALRIRSRKDAAARARAARSAEREARAAVRGAPGGRKTGEASRGPAAGKAAAMSRKRAGQPRRRR
jgi:DNA transformation protein